ncbi:hypothetical protein ECTT12B_2501, partial [Escherichia coli TT12B]
MFIHGSDHHRG